MNDLISIIIPVYKVEKYLPQCIESVMKQTYENIEIILIDDGSPDASGRICDEYAARDLRIKVIHKENSGVSSARNEGIAAAKGKYICFVDSDDQILDNYVQRLYEAILEKNADIASCGFYRSIDGALTKNKKNQYEDSVVYSSSNNFYDLFCLDHRASVPWNKMFRADIIRKNGVRFPEGIHPGEDSLFVAIYSKYAECAVFLSDTLYVYVDSDVSVCRATETRSFFENDEKITAVLDSILSGGNDPVFVSSIRIKKMYVLMHMIYDNKKYKLKKDTARYRREVNEYLPFFLSYHIPFRIKLRYILMILSPFWFDKIKKLYRRLS